MLTRTATRIIRIVAIVACGLGLMSAAGCNQPTLFPNPDPNLRKSIPELKADAAQRFPYKADAPRALEAKARAQVGYDTNRLEVVNFSGEDWTDVEVWVNRQYVCHVPKMESRQMKLLPFAMLLNELGQPFPRNNRTVQVETVELYRNGTLYQIICRPADF